MHACSESGERFPDRYRLYAYHDGNWAGGDGEAAAARIASASRSAVLFVSGHLGSFRQARSLGRGLHDVAAKLSVGEMCVANTLFVF
jgi:hypothetical protein